MRRGHSKYCTCAWCRTYPDIPAPSWVWRPVRRFARKPEPAFLLLDHAAFTFQGTRTLVVHLEKPGEFVVDGRLGLRPETPPAVLGRVLYAVESRHRSRRQLFREFGKRWVTTEGQGLVRFLVRTIRATTA